MLPISLSLSLFGFQQGGITEIKRLEQTVQNAYIVANANLATNGLEALKLFNELSTSDSKLHKKIISTIGLYNNVHYLKIECADYDIAKIDTDGYSDKTIINLVRTINKMSSKLGEICKFTKSSSK